MIKVTNDAKAFFEKEQGEIIIYGAGNAGYWIGYFMERCDITYSFYIDRDAKDFPVMYNEHPIFPPEKLKEYKNAHIRMVISPNVYKEILADLLWMDHLWSLDILCVIPQYPDLVMKEDRYNINRFLGYFRGKLFEGDFPTIISNTCIAGRLYEAFNMPLLSPLINAGLDASDYVKLCTNLKEYMDEELRILYWEKGTRLGGSDTVHVVGQLGDLRVIFAHVDDDSNIVEYWNLMRDRINWNRIIYVMEEQGYRQAIDFDIINKFMNLPGKKLYVKGANFFEDIAQKPFFAQYSDAPNRREPAIENYFNIVDWINKK